MLCPTRAGKRLVPNAFTHPRFPRFRSSFSPQTSADTTSGNGMCMQFKLGFMGIINVEVGGGGRGENE